MKNSNQSRWKHLLSMLLLIGLFLSCSEEPLEEITLETADLAVAASNVIPDHYIVVLSEKPMKEDPRSAVALEAISKEVGNMAGARVKAKYKHSLTGFSARLSKGQLKKLEKDPRVVMIVPDKIIKLETSYETGIVTVQENPTWGLDRLDQRGGILDRAYSQTATGAGVDVYIMDSGIRYSHKEFGGRAVFGVDMVNLYPEDHDITEPEVEPGADCRGHGTHVAGTVGGENYGVAKGVNLISVRVFSCAGISSESRVLKAIDWVTANAALEENANRPAVVNMSMGGLPDEALETGLINSIASGIHYVVSAGNAATEACEQSPARVPAALTVGASDITNRRASFSNFGSCVDVFAPGVEITSAGIADDTASQLMNGTSMAAPHVTGLVALYLEDHPDATPAEVHAAVVENSTPNAVSDVPSGTNKMAFSHWTPVEFTPPVQPDLNLQVYGVRNGPGSDIFLIWDGTGSTYYTIYKNGVVEGTVQNVTEFRLDARKNSKDVFKVCETYYNNCSEEVRPNFDDWGDFQPNMPPSASFTYVINGLEVQFTNTSEDQDGHIDYSIWRFGDGGSAIGANPSHKYEEPGTFYVQLNVYDDKGSEGVIYQGIVIPAEGIEAPPIANFGYNVNGLSVQFEDNSRDTNGTIEERHWDFGDGRISSEKDPLHVYAEAGTYLVSLTVTDDSAETDTFSWNITVSAEGSISLSAIGSKEKGQWRARLNWDSEGVSGPLEIYRNGQKIATVESSGGHIDQTEFKGSGDLTYVICTPEGSTCSNEVRLQF